MPNLSLTDRIIIKGFKEKNKWVCYYCNKNIVDKSDLTVDHKKPLSRGGLTEDTNLAISCARCNREKDNMTDMEYLIFKEKQGYLCGSLGFIDTIEKLYSVYDNFIEEAKTIKSEYIYIEKRIQRIIDDIGAKNFNAYQGYIMAKELKDNLRRRKYLKSVKEAYDTLHTLIGNNKKHLQEVNEKIINNILLSQYKELKDSCITGNKNTVSLRSTAIYK